MLLVVPVERASAFTSLLDRQLDAGYRLAAVILGNRIEAEQATHDAAVWSDLDGRAARRAGAGRRPAGDRWLDRNGERLRPVGGNQQRRPCRAGLVVGDALVAAG